jgi:hypothetical protein
MNTSTPELILFHKFLPTTIGRGVHALDVHRIKACMLASVPSMQSAALLSDLTQPPAGNGYVSGGVVCAVSPLSEYVGGEYSWRITFVPSFPTTSTGYSAVGIAFYNDTAPSKNLIAAGFFSPIGPVAITNVSQTGTTATITKAAHGLANGNVVVLDRLPFPWMNGTRTVANVTTDTFDVTVSISETVAGQAVTSGKLIKPETATVTGDDGSYTASFGPNGAFTNIRS